MARFWEPLCNPIKPTNELIMRDIVDILIENEEEQLKLLHQWCRELGFDELAIVGDSWGVPSVLVLLCMLKEYFDGFNKNHIPSPEFNQEYLKRLRDKNRAKLSSEKHS